MSAALDLLQKLRVKVFADGADLAGIIEMSGRPYIKGFTTNPTLMRKAGVADYREFARRVVRAVPDRPISFEVFSDEFDEMEAQALEIASWGANINVKIPVTNTRGTFSGPVIRRLSERGVPLNITAIMTIDQVEAVATSLSGSAPAYISVFAGRIADTGRDPVPTIEAAVRRAGTRPGTEIIWASPRELLNVFQADAAGCHVITVSNDVLNKVAALGKDLTHFSLDTVKMFRDDALKAGFRIVPVGSAI